MEERSKGIALEQLKETDDSRTTRQVNEWIQNNVKINEEKVKEQHWDG